MPRTIAVDFDGVIVEDKWPDIGEPIEAAIDALKREKAGGAKLILWTCRAGERLREAAERCAALGIEFDAVCENLPENVAEHGGDTRKVCADEYWDDKSARPPGGKTADLRVAIPDACCLCQLYSDRTDCCYGMQPCKYIFEDETAGRPGWCPLGRDGRGACST